ncbi:MAG: Mrp/NBP35 family ATP-binding protein [Chloroflexi bacterium]|nr:Mrp/NBP35 family ATP-binding protein [Chloroflexota bacterium]
MVTTEHVVDALRAVEDPELKRDIVDLGMVRDVRVEGDQVRLTLALTTLNCPLRERLVEDIRRAILALEGVGQVEMETSEMTAEEKGRLQGTSEPEGTVAHLNEIGHVVSVMSGKGGVGKSLVSALLAIGLRRAGHQVGVLDADITGPSIPKMFFRERPRLETSPMAFIPPQSKTGIRVMSINLLLDSEDQAVIWRGPLIGRAIQQFWGEVLWGRLDYLVVDLPPGTSDAPLTVMQSLPQSGVVLVTSPQDLAGMVVRKAARMAQQLGIPILGLIENMSYFVCPDTGKQHEVFGPSHAHEIASELGVPLLSRLPLDPEISRLCDQGRIEDYWATSFEPVVERIIASAFPAKPPLFPAQPAPSRPGVEAQTPQGPG